MYKRQALGRTRTPGILGVTLLAGLAPLFMFGLVFGLELPRSGTGVLALIPQAAAGHTLFETFLPAGTALRGRGLDASALDHVDLFVAIGTLGMLVFAYLGLRALERRVGGLAPALLRRGEYKRIHADGDVMVFMRSHNKENVTVAFNVSAEEKTVELALEKKHKVLFGKPRIEGNQVIIPPRSGVVIK